MRGGESGVVSGGTRLRRASRSWAGLPQTESRARPSAPMGRDQPPVCDVTPQIAMRFACGTGPYRVRSAVTRRASRTIGLAPAVRRQEASKFGQACCEQSLPTARMSSRSPLASGYGHAGFDLGAKPGRTVSAAAMNAATAIAESALIMTVPCHGALAARRFVGWTSSQRQVSGCLRHCGNGFVRRASFVSSADWRTKQCRLALKTPGARNWFSGRDEIKCRTGWNRPGLPGRAGQAREGYAPYRALSRLFRSRHQRPSGRGPAAPSTLCDRLIVAIGVHPGKKPLFSTEERLDMVRAVFAADRQTGRLRLRLHHL